VNQKKSTRKEKKDRRTPAGGPKKTWEKCVFCNNTEGLQYLDLNEEMALDGENWKKTAKNLTPSKMKKKKHLKINKKKVKST